MPKPPDTMLKTNPQKIFLAGYGKMAEAILQALVSMEDRFEIWVIGRHLQKASALASKYLQNPRASTDGFQQTLDIDGHILLLAIKPYALASLNTKGCAKRVLSVLAGVDIQALQACVHAEIYVRAMPNIAAFFKKSCTALYSHATQDPLAQEIFEQCGSVLWLSHESKFDAAMAISGSSPAFLALFAESLSDAGVREGLTREESYAFIKGLFEGFPCLLDHKSPSQIKEEVASPSGVTIEGIAALESHAFRGAIIDAIHKVVAKAKKP